MRELLNAQRMHALLAVQNAETRCRYGLVDSYDPNFYTVKVLIQPEGTLSGWLPLTADWIGNGWGIFSPPSIGDLVVVEYPDGAPDDGFVSKRFFTDKDRPLNVPSGELWIVHKNGAFLKLTNDGKLLINCSVEVDIGDLGSSVHALVTDAFQTLFNNHVHTSGTAGSPTSTPTTQMGATHLTTKLKAN